MFADERLQRVGLACLLPCLQLGCLGAHFSPNESQAPATINAPTIPPDTFSTLKNAADAHTELCANDGMHPNFPDDADLITKTFCQDVKPGGVMPTPRGLADLQKQLGLGFADPNGENGSGANPAFALLGHSSALTARKVSSIMPTAFVFTPPPADGSKPSGYVFLGFDPGEQFVEVASHDPTVDVVNFYLVLFDKDCTKTAAGCGNDDLLTPQLTQGWSNVRVYESSTALNNTIADCRQCHAPNNDSPAMLRMQEILPGNTHFFTRATDCGQTLLADFHAAHGTSEDYGPIPAALIDKSDPTKMAALITRAGFGDQPNAFDSTSIESEVRANSPDQPVLNDPPSASATWQKLYDSATAGQFIAAPYHDAKVTDPAKLATMTTAYQQWRSGALGQLPDVREVFLDMGLRDMGFAPRLGANGHDLLVQMCQQCHNQNLDPAITRDRFLVDQIDQMSRTEKDLAITRLTADQDSRLFMPPLLFRTVTDSERDLMIAELQK